MPNIIKWLIRIFIYFSNIIWIKKPFARAFFWRDERTTIPYDLWVIAILAFVWMTPPDWVKDPVAMGQPGLLQWVLSHT